MNCVIEGCDQPISSRARSPVCHLCRANLGHWAKRRPAEVLHRRQRLKLFTNRMDEVEAWRGRNKK
jgi:hypothetical protein